jgi:hypothetical protein
MSIKYINIPYKVLVMEDEEFILQDLHGKLVSDLNKRYSKSQHISEYLPNHRIKIEASVSKVDNMQEAESIVYAGDCDVLITDLMVKENAKSRKNSASCLSLLRDIRRDLPFIPVIGHSVYMGQLDSAMENQLTLHNVNKSEPDSVSKCVKMGKETGIELNTYKQNILSAFEALKSIETLISPIDKQNAIEQARLFFTTIKFPFWTPDEYKRTISTIEPVLYRISSVPSESLGIKEVKSDFIECLSPIINGLCNPMFSFKNDALPYILDLEAKGYNIFMRF